VDALLEAGARVVVVDCSQSNIEETRTRLGGADVSFEQVDVTDPDAVTRLADRLGTVDILVNNAGIGRQTAAEETTDAE
jgi:NAD(P)-dependent dehydrogenase (short-subunit alcohol dehydrogenase family)